jgi:hypothetical protein
LYWRGEHLARGTQNSRRRVGYARSDDERIDHLKGQIAKKLARIFECTRLMDLNRGDSSFRVADGASSSAAAEGEIFYVVDTNFVQAFLQPMAWRSSSRLFHDIRLWPPTEHEEKLGYDELVAATAAQATMLATEFFFEFASKTSPRRIYMSDPHRKELVEQLERLSVRYPEVVTDAAFANYAKSQNEKITSIAGCAERSRAEATEIMVAEKVAFSAEDLEKLNDADFARVRNNFIVSTICRIIAQDDLLEPAEQIARLTTELWPRFYPIEWEFEASTEQDNREIQALNKTWLALLEAEFDKRRAPPKSAGLDGISLGRERKRDRHSLKADATTLAHLMWAARWKAGPRQRVVFVTGDRVILNAYREWYADHGENLSFMIRPLAFFAPQYNLRDGRAALSREMRVFDHTRQSLETWTAPLTNALRSHYFEGRPDRFARFSGARARDRFCVEAEDDAVSEDLIESLIPLSDNLQTLERESENVDAMADAMRWLERLSIGAMPTLVNRRVDQATKNAQDFLNKVGAEGGNEVVLRWVQERLDRAMSTGFEFTLPATVKQIEALEAASRAKETPEEMQRVRPTLRIRLPYGDDEPLLPADWLARYAAERSAAEIAAKKRISGEAKPADVNAPLRKLAEQPANLFALASWLAFRHNLYNDAVRAADFASRACDSYIAEGIPVERDLQLECLYLKALALRVRMANEPPTENHDADVWIRDLDGAESALQLCIDGHEKANQRVRKIRALAERVSVRLSYCAWAAVGKLSALGAYRENRLQLQDVFRGAVEDLQACRSMLPSVREYVARLDDNDPDRNVQKSTLEWVELQVRVDPECARVIYELLTTRLYEHKDEYLMAGMPGVHKALVDMEWPIDAPKETNKLMQAYALSYRARRDKKAAAGLADISEDDVSLALDKAMLGAIKELAASR